MDLMIKTQSLIVTEFLQKWKSSNQDILQFFTNMLKEKWVTRVAIQ